MNRDWPDSFDGPPPDNGPGANGGDPIRGVIVAVTITAGFFVGLWVLVEWLR